MPEQPPATAGRLFLLAGALSGLLSAALGVAGGMLEGALTGPWPDAGVMFLAIALLSLRLQAYPRWLGWIAAAAATAAFVSTLSLVPADGPLAPTGVLTTALRLVPLFWYVPAAVVMLRPAGRPPRTAV